MQRILHAGGKLLLDLRAGARRARKHASEKCSGQCRSEQ
jgi:hypothetical protein